jgi:hypothetical protein
MSYKIYRRHGCSSRHRTWNKVAECIWPRSVWVTGEGRYAVLAWCRSLTVTLWESPAEAENAKQFIDKLACGGMCSRDHEIVELDPSIRA